MKKKQCLLIFGMHRSGTSAFAGLLNQLGIPMGILKEESFDNPKGFYENKKVIQFNDQILRVLGQAWDTTIALPTDWLGLQQMIALKATIKDFLQTAFKGKEIFALKDPRFSLTLPLWKEALRELSIDVHQLILVRHPHEVANSLHQRNYMAQSKGIVLWMKYMVNAELASRGNSRDFIGYQDFLKAPAATIKRLSIDFKFTDAQLEKKAMAFINLNLKHHHSIPLTEGTLVANIYQMIDSLIKNKENKNTLAKLDTIREGVDYQTTIIAAPLFATLTLDYGKGFTQTQRIAQLIQADTTQLCDPAESE